MRINFLLPDANLGGGTRVIAIYAQKLQQMGHDVFVTSTPLKSPSLKAKIKHFLKNGKFPDKPEKGPSHLDHTTVTHSVIRQDRPITDQDLPDADIAIATWWETAEWLEKLSPRKGIKAYFLQHYEAFDYLPKERVDATWRLPMHKIVIAQWLVDLAYEKFGDNDVSLVPNSVDTEQFFAAARARQQTPTVGMLYSTAYWKGCDIALKAFEIASQTIPNLKLVALGANKPHPSLPLPEKCEYFLLPPQDQLKTVYAKCDAWLFASRTEGFGLPLLEAMACRTPVIATSAGAAPDLLTQSKAGFLLPSHDPAIMADKIVDFFAMSEQDWQKMSDDAFECVRRYNWDQAAQKFEAALFKAIEKSKNRQSSYSGSDL